MIERLFIFAKAQVSSFFGGIVDYLVMILCTELFHVFYPYSVATYFFTAYMGIDYKISRIMTDLIVSLLFNCTLQRFWVFKRVQ